MSVPQGRTLGLYLRVDPTGRRYWEQRVTVRGRRRTLGIGRYPIVTLKVAREAALENLRVVQAGDDPIALRRAVRRVPTLTEAARAVVELHRSKWSSSRHPNIRMASLEQRRHRSRPVAGLRALVHGHFVVDEVQRVGNRWNIDTGATFVGRNRLTLLHVNAPRIRPWTFDVEEGLMV